MYFLQKAIRLLRALPYSIYFCFRFLPIRQAIKVPILLYKPKINKGKGQIIINGGGYFGMIKLGFPLVSIVPNSGIALEIRGIIEFGGKCMIGNGSCIATGERCHLHFGDKFVASAGLRIVCYHNIFFEDNVRVGWECMFLDSSMHRLTRLDRKPIKSYAPIHIGANNWFGTQCLVMKGTKTPAYTTIAARTTLTRSYLDFPEYSIIGSRKAVEVLSTGVWRNTEDDMILYTEFTEG